MRLKTLAICSTLIMVSMLAAQSAQAFPRVFTTGVTTAIPDKIQPGYVLSWDVRPYFNDLSPAARMGGPLSGLPDFPNNKVLLIDLNGNIAHQWDMTGYNPMRVRLLPNGNLAFINLGKPYALVPQVAKGQTKAAREDFVAGLVELDWSGKEVFRLDTLEGYHHDFRKLPNGNILILSAGLLPKEYQDKVRNIDLQWWPNLERSAIPLGGDIILEITPQGEKVWEWKSWEHLDVNRFSPLNAVADWTHGNTASPLPPNKFYDAGDKRFKPGNIIFNPRNLDMVCIIDRETGKIVWTYTGNYKGGLAHPHDTNMVPSPLKGAGNILIYDNGLFPKHRDHSGQSFILEVNPTTGDIEWKYEAKGFASMRFFSVVNGVTDKLSNNNVFITEDNTGRVFQVLPDPKHPDGGEIVWEYVHTGSFLFATFYEAGYCPQFGKLPKITVEAVTPLDPSTLKLLPDSKRKDGNVISYTPKKAAAKK